MMATGHALSGAAVGYASCLLVETTVGHPFPWLVPHAAAVVCAGWALWPDCDSLKSAVSTSLGLVTRVLHEVVVHFCAVIYYATRTEKDDPKKPVIHRGATHTWPAAMFMGALVAILCLAWPRWATPGILGLSMHWGLRGLYMPTSPDHKLTASKLKGKSVPRRVGIVLYHHAGVALKRHAVEVMRMVPMPGKYLRAFGRSGTLAICMGSAFYATETTGAFDTRWAAMLGAAATIGCLTHLVGDSLTESGICWFFPFRHPRTGRRWEPVHLPKWLAFKTGRALEIGVVYPLCIFAILLAMPGGYALLLEIYAAWRNGGGHVTALRFAPWQKTPQLLT